MFFLLLDQGLNILFCFRLIKKLPRKFYKRLQSNLFKYKQAAETGSEGPPCAIASTVDRSQVEVLCYQAFLDELKPRQTKYKILIGLLVNRLRCLHSAVVDIDFNEIRERSDYFRMIKLWSLNNSVLKKRTFPAATVTVGFYLSVWQQERSWTQDTWACAVWFLCLFSRKGVIEFEFSRTVNG